jgi:hypothetical protein
MSEVVLLLPNTHRFQQVEVYIRGCTTSTKYWSLSASWRLCPRLYYFYQILTAFNTLSTVEEYPFYRWQLISFACRSHNAVTSFVYHKRKNKKYHTVETFPKPNRKNIENSKIDNPNTQIHDHSLFCLGTRTSIKNGRDKLVWWTQASPLLNIILWGKTWSKLAKMQMNNYFHHN